MNASQEHDERLRATAIRVLLANDCQIVLWGLEQLIDGEAPRMKVVAAVTNNGEALLQTRALHPDVILLDLRLNDESSVDLIPDLVGNTQGHVLVLATKNDKALFDRAVLNGAYGVIRKEDPVESIIKAIERVHQGELWLDRATAGQLFMALAGNADKHQHNSEIQRRASLTPKEHNIIAVLVKHPGARSKELANRLHMSEHTLRNHLSQIYSKLEVSNRLELFAYASHCGLGSSPH